MCLITINKEPIVAEEDIKVYKVLVNLENKLTSPYYKKFSWERGNLYESEILMEPNKYETCWVIENALHSFIDVYKANHLAANRRKFYDDAYVVEMIIPKGSTYYVNTLHDEVASDKLYFPKQEETNETSNQV